MQDTIAKLNQYQIRSILIEFKAVQTGKPSKSFSNEIQSLVFKWLSFGDEELAQKVLKANISPLIVSTLIGNSHQGKIKQGDRFFLRINILENELIKPLLKGIESQKNQLTILAGFLFTIAKTYIRNNSHKLSKSTDYYSLALYPPAVDNIILKFLSPTSFQQKNQIHHFPLPELVFNCLFKKWNHFAPKELHFSRQKWNGSISAYDLRTRILTLEDKQEMGCQGWIKYSFPNKEQIRIASILGNFAFYAGVGHKTSMGMGQCQLLFENKQLVENQR